MDSHCYIIYIINEHDVISIKNVIFDEKVETERSYTEISQVSPNENIERNSRRFESENCNYENLFDHQSTDIVDHKNAEFI